jgi:hypothetical protein
MAEINFYINTTGFSYDLETNGSGLAFFGTGFGTPVAVGQYQDTTFVSDGNGLSQGAQGKNVKWLMDLDAAKGNSGSGIITGDVEALLTHIPNYQSTLNIRFTHGSAVNTQNAELRIYDRNSINSPSVGVTTKVAEIIHPSETYGGGVHLGSGDSDWTEPAGSAVYLNFSQSPGVSGMFGFGPNNPTMAGGTGGAFVQHDWYAAISASPDSIGNKTSYGLYFALEYL